MRYETLPLLPLRLLILLLIGLAVPSISSAYDCLGRKIISSNDGGCGLYKHSKKSKGNCEQYVETHCWTTGCTYWKCAWDDSDHKCQGTKQCDQKYYKHPSDNRVPQSGKRH